MNITQFVETYEKLYQEVLNAEMEAFRAGDKKSGTFLKLLHNKMLSIEVNPLIGKHKSLAAVTRVLSYIYEQNLHTVNDKILDVSDRLYELTQQGVEL